MKGYTPLVGGLSVHSTPARQIVNLQLDEVDRTAPRVWGSRQSIRYTRDGNLTHRTTGPRVARRALPGRGATRKIKPLAQLAHRSLYDRHLYDHTESGEPAVRG
eukprot:3763373-Prymnesium_polylepis.1